MLLRALAVVAAVAAPALLVMIAVPETVLRLGFGEEYVAGADALPLLGLAMTTLALTYLAVNYLLAIGARAFLVPLGLVARRRAAAARGRLVRLARLVRGGRARRAGRRRGRRARALAAPRPGSRPGGRVIARVAVVVAALAGIVLLAGELRTARDIDRAVAVSVQPGRADEALALLRAAAARTPDTTPLLREAQLQLLRRRPGEAIGAAREAVRREPENAQGWLLLAQAAEGSGDAGLAADARRRVAALVARP